MKLQSNDFAWEMFRFPPIHTIMFSLEELPSFAYASQFPSVVGLLECFEIFLILGRRNSVLKSWKLSGANLPLELQSKIAVFHDFYR
jgi:hypothetical protein